VIQQIHYLKLNDMVEVVAVKISQELLLLYVVKQWAYPYYCFMITEGHEITYPP
jgi:hypothetical protein